MATVAVDTLLSQSTPQMRLVRPLNMPQGLPNIGNTCCMDGLAQCCRQLLARSLSVYPDQCLPRTEQCPLAAVLKERAITEDEIKRWGCWTHLAIGPQRDAGDVLEQLHDPTSAMHASCSSDE
ncbi:hypothetical protein N9L68_08845 [bacterium]|nr:hypothetical protein [bacterium]